MLHVITIAAAILAAASLGLVALCAAMSRGRGAPSNVDVALPIPDGFEAAEQLQVVYLERTAPVGR